MSSAWLFPGQGSQYPGMSRHAFAEGRARDLFELAERLAAQSIARVAQYGPRERLREPLLAELALCTVSLANARQLRASSAPAVVAGYSAGETAALCCAGVLSEGDALRAAAIRGRVLAAYSDPAAQMITVSGLDKIAIAALLAAHHGSLLAISGWNADRHFSVVGDELPLRRFVHAARSRGAQVGHVDVAGPWHTQRLRPAVREVLEGLRDIHFRAPECPLFMSASGCRESDPKQIRQLYALQLCLPVAWVHVIRSIAATQRPLTWIDVGPNRTLHAYLLRSSRGAPGWKLVAAERLLGASQPRHEPHATGREKPQTGAI